MSADIPREIDQIATRIASNYLHMNISCQRLYDEVVEALLARDKRAAENEEVLRNLEQAILQCRTLADFLTVQKTVQVMQASGAYDTPTGQEDVAARSEAEAIENLRVDMYGDKGRPDIYDGLLPRATRTTGQEDAP